MFIKEYGFDPREYDLGRMEWDKFIPALNYCVMKMYAALETGGRMGILMGDIRRNGKYYSMLRDIAQPGELEGIIIKKQVNASSYNNSYSGSFIPIVHEWFMILRKALPYMLDFSYTRKMKLDIRDSKDASWKDVLLAVFESHKGRVMKLEEIYKEVDGYRRTQSNPHWREKVRQTLGTYKILFQRVDNGAYCMAV